MILHDTMHLFYHHDLFTFQKFFRNTRQLLERQRYKWSEVLHEGRFICRSIRKFISLTFFQHFLIFNILIELFRNFESVLHVPTWVLPILSAD